MLKNLKHQIYHKQADGKTEKIMIIRNEAESSGFDMTISCRYVINYIHLTPRPPSLKGQGERSETPLSASGRGWGRGFRPNPPTPFPERAGGEV